MAGVVDGFNLAQQAQGLDPINSDFLEDVEIGNLCDCSCESDPIFLFPGCTNEAACNYNSIATFDDASCILADSANCEECCFFEAGDWINSDVYQLQRQLVPRSNGLCSDWQGRKRDGYRRKDQLRVWTEAQSRLHSTRRQQIS